MLNSDEIQYTVLVHKNAHLIFYFLFVTIIDVYVSQDWKVNCVDRGHMISIIHDWKLRMAFMLNHFGK